MSNAEVADSPTDAADDDPLVGTVLGDRYRIESQLGVGGMGRVYLAEHVHMRKRLAVKVLHRELTTVPEVLARFEREAMAAANIEHPNVAAATDFGKLDDGSVYLVLEYVKGHSLRDLVDQGPLQLDRALHICRQVASALSVAHGLEIVHRDLKPENVMLVTKGNDPDFVKVLDFGIARVPIGEGASESATGGVLTKAGVVYGTPEYMAPEQALGQPVDGRADIYALGVILYECISGVRPFKAESVVGVLGQQLSQDPPKFTDRVPELEVPAEVERFVLRMLRKEASERYQNIDELIERFDALLGGTLPPSLAAPASEYANELGMASMPSSPGLPSQPAIDGIASSPGVGSSPGMASQPGLPSSPGVPSSGTIRIDMPSSADGSLPPGGVPSRPGSIAGVAQTQRGLPVALIAAAAGGALLVVVLVVVLVVGALNGDSDARAAGSASGTTPAVEPVEGGERAPATQLTAAKQKGSDALKDLAKEYPKDTDVALALAKAQILERKHPEAVDTIAALLKRNDELAKHPEVASLMWMTAQVKTSEDKAFALLQNDMGTKGPDIIYDLSRNTSVPARVRKRADEWMETKEFAQRSSPALHVTRSLEQAKKCEQKHGLLLRAKNAGDERTLAYLRKLERVNGCGRSGRSDCYPCMRKDDLLKTAISEIEKREKGGG